jgi:hypothetical protein
VLERRRSPFPGAQRVPRGLVGSNPIRTTGSNPIRIGKNHAC